MVYQYFIAGIIQGSKKDLDVYDQSYRKTIKEILRKAFPESRVLCPVEKKAKEVFHYHLKIVNNSHALIVYLPEASMGSAIEMWEAHHENRIVLVISPMKSNWIVRLFSDEIFTDIEEFESFVISGRLHQLLEDRFPIYNNLENIE